MKKITVLILIFSVLCVPLFSDAVFLKNGQVLEGKITGETANQVGIKTTDKSFYIDKNDIERLVYAPKDDKPFINWGVVIPAVICAAAFLLALFWRPTT